MKKITKNKEKRLMNFAQELSWVFESFKDVSFKDIYEFFQQQDIVDTNHTLSDDTQYPFDISYTYDKTRLDGKFEDDTSTPDAKGTFHYHTSWEYQGDGTDVENLARDILDTQFGKDAYTYYQDEGNDSLKAIEITVKITSSMIHPNTED